MIEVVHDRARLRRGELSSLCARLRAVERAAGLGALAVTVVLTDDDAIASLNEAFRGKAKPTDVLSFSAWEGEPMPGTEHELGDVVISLDTARRQATELGHGLADEIAVLFAHGIMHLLGLDHERGLIEARWQAECEMTVLAAAGLSPDLALSRRGLR